MFQVFSLLECMRHEGANDQTLHVFEKDRAAAFVYDPVKRKAVQKRGSSRSTADFILDATCLSCDHLRTMED